ncbi:MAG TPA: TCR/Tet family MFS transporter [Caulobacteraceae bacterium]|nr:TCR/Tet family MFS transporter [Caulobacteraceae bacterium]
MTGTSPAGNAAGAPVLSRGSGSLVQGEVIKDAPTTPEAGAAPHSPAALGFILVSALLNALSVGVIFPVFPTLVKLFTHGDASQAATALGWFGAVWALMQLLFCPLLGVLSDRFGRRPVLLISMFGQAADYLLMALSPTLAWLFVGRMISGATGASTAVAGAYIADVTTPAARARNFGYLAAVNGAGAALGPALGGLVGEIGPRAPFWLAAGLALANGVYGLVVLRESLPTHRRAPFELARANPLGSLRFLMTHPAVVGLILVYFLDQFASFPLNSILVLYANVRYRWGPRDIGAVLTVMVVAAVVVQGLVAAPVARRIGERGAVILGFGFAAVGLCVLGLAANGVVFWIGLFVTALSSVANPSLQALLTRAAGPSEQGELQGAMSSLFGVSRLVGPLVFTTAFAWSLGSGQGYHVPGLAILLGAVVFVIGMPVIAFGTGRSTRSATA